MACCRIQNKVNDHQTRAARELEAASRVPGNERLATILQALLALVPTLQQAVGREGGAAGQAAGGRQEAQPAAAQSGRQDVDLDDDLYDLDDDDAGGREKPLPCGKGGTGWGGSCSRPKQEDWQTWGCRAASLDQRGPGSVDAQVAALPVAAVPQAPIPVPFNTVAHSNVVDAYHLADPFAFGPHPFVADYPAFFV